MFKSISFYFSVSLLCLLCTCTQDQPGMCGKIKHSPVSTVSTHNLRSYLCLPHHKYNFKLVGLLLPPTYPSLRCHCHWQGVAIPHHSQAVSLLPPRLSRHQTSQSASLWQNLCTCHWGMVEGCNGVKMTRTLTLLIWSSIIFLV